MNNDLSIEYLQPPEQLLSGFLDFAKDVHQKSLDKGKLSEEELSEIFENIFSGRVRAKFFLWITDLNKIIDVINIILCDLSELRKDRNSLKGDPVVRSEFLFQAFFGEFFKIREISKIFIKYLMKEGVLNSKLKETFVDSYFKGFDYVYQVRNRIVHLGSSIKDQDYDLDFSFLEELTKDERGKFISLIKESNTRENTVEIQCAIYMKSILGAMKSYIGFQNILNGLLADFIISYERLNLKITISENTG